MHEQTEKFRIAVSQKTFNFKEHVFSCSLSIGLTKKLSGKIEAMLKNADENLYRAKELGRNRVIIDPD